MATAIPPSSRKRDLTQGSLTANLFRLAAPLAAGMALHALYALVDAFWLGRWSKTALAAPGACSALFFIAVALGMGFGSAGTALVAQHTGAGRHREADRAAAQNLALLTAIALALALPMFLCAPWLLRIANVPPDVIPQALVYFRISMIGLPMIAFSIAYGSVLRALGDSITVLWIGVATNLMNLALDPLLIYGWRGLPAFGVGGAAAASVAAQIVGALACWLCLKRGRAGLRLRPVDFRPDWPLLRQSLVIGTPAAIGHATTSIGFAVFMVMVNEFGTAVVGAFTVGFRLIHFFHIPSQAMAMAATPVVGQALGAGKPELARRAVKVSAGLVAALTFVPFALLTWQGALVARVFTRDAEVIAEAARFFLVVPASSYFFGVLMVLTAAFYGSGHTRSAMVLSILRLWVFRLPLGYLLGFTLGYGSMGVYVGMVLANVFSAIAALWLFHERDWEEAVVPAAAPPTPSPQAPTAPPR